MRIIIFDFVRLAFVTEVCLLLITVPYWMIVALVSGLVIFIFELLLTVLVTNYEAVSVIGLKKK